MGGIHTHEEQSMVIEITPGSIVSDGHVLLTGPITGKVTLDDGTEVDVTPIAIEVESPERALEIDKAIGAYWADPSTPPHPDHITPAGEDDIPFVWTPAEPTEG